MAGVDLGSIVTHLRLEMNDFNSGLNDAVNRIRETQQQFEGLSSFGKSLSTVGAGLTASITAPVMALGASVVQTQMKFQDSFNKHKYSVFCMIPLICNNANFRPSTLVLIHVLLQCHFQLTFL